MNKKSLLFSKLSFAIYSSSVPRAWMAPGMNIWKKISSISSDEYGISASNHHLITPSMTPAK